MRVDYCRGCLEHSLVTLHDFGAQPLAGEYPTEPQSVRAAKRYPLELTQCGHCGLLQIPNLPPIGEVFHSDYRYSSSTVPGLVAHFVEYATWLKRHLADGARVFEFGCNDGVLLDKLRALGIDCAGVDASDNVATLARAKGLPVTTGFLTEEFVKQAGTGGTFDLVTCSNVFAHIHDLHSTLAAVLLLLKSGGLFAVEVHNGDYIASQNQFDTIYHEHLTYFTAETLRSLLERHGFDFVLCEQTAMHGGGLRCLVRKRDPEVAAAGKIETEISLGSQDVIREAIERCRQQLGQLYATHGPLTGYGAAGRSQMFINFTASARYFSRVYDDSPLRRGRYIVGTDVPIVEFKGEFSRCAVILAWNYADDISAKLRGRCDQITILLPEFRIL